MIDVTRHMMDMHSYDGNTFRDKVAWAAAWQTNSCLALGIGKGSDWSGTETGYTYVTRVYVCARRVWEVEERSIKILSFCPIMGISSLWDEVSYIYVSLPAGIDKAFETWA